MDNERYDTQYFEHAIFELHPENDPPHDVQLAHAGTSVFNTRYPKGNPLATYPLYPNGRNFTYEQSVGGFILSFVTRFQTSDSPDVVRAYFDKLLLSRGWKRATSQAPSSVTYRLTEPWDIPECQPGFQGPSPVLPCASSYFLDISATASGGLTDVVEILEHDTFCCHAARNNAFPAMK
jgi:hypothetical protein